MTTQPAAPHVPDSNPAAYAAAAFALLFGAVNAYWAAGGTAGLDTLGGRIEEMAAAGDPAVAVANLVAVVLKAAGALLALALVRPWGRRLPQRALWWTGLCAAALLLVYGLLQTGAVALVASGLVRPDVPWPDRVVYWRLFLWEPAFLVWGALLAAALWRARAGRVRASRVRAGRVRASGPA